MTTETMPILQVTSNEKFCVRHLSMSFSCEQLLSEELYLTRKERPLQRRTLNNSHHRSSRCYLTPVTVEAFQWTVMPERLCREPEDCRGCFETDRKPSKPAGNAGGIDFYGPSFTDIRHQQ